MPVVSSFSVTFSLKFLKFLLLIYYFWEHIKFCDLWNHHSVDLHILYLSGNAEGLEIFIVVLSIIRGVADKS